ncbi:VC2662 family protein [Ferrimonas marina]|uniref:PhaC PHA synthase n=1 Tax=Ferrimonas marina TaxID=299255 RepID=A0A1M5ZPW8_9GAMM|nr:phaC PHA synthase [Ferrimonas marina]SHI26244.1 hypothetical protein SAMN02745129_0462 [Ferrimonas marina]
MKLRGFMGLALASALVSATAAAEQAVPVQLATLNGVNAMAGDQVEGVRFPTLYGKTESVKGVDLHLLGIGETDEFVGVQFPLLIAGANHVNKSMTGVSFGLWNWNKGMTKGANLGMVNVANDVHGANVGLVNVSQGYTAFDWSAVNVSESSHAQLGIFNKTTELKGIQLGLINCADNGFLPCFPLFNFAPQ